MAERLLTPSKITAWLDCAHFLTLQHEVEAGARTVEHSPFGEMAQMLLDKGLEHERAVLDRYRSEGLSVFEVPERVNGESFQQWVDRVGDVLAEGHDVVFQMPFVHEGIRGIADFLRRVDHDHAVGHGDAEAGTFSYEPIDAKLARRQAKPGHVLQLCFYAEAIEASTGVLPEWVHIELGSGRSEAVPGRRCAAVLASPAWPVGEAPDRRRRGRHPAQAVRSLPVLRVRVGVRGRLACRRFTRPRGRNSRRRSPHAPAGSRDDDRRAGRARSRTRP